MSDQDTRDSLEFPPRPALSTSGRAREAQILDALHRAAAARKLRRTAVRRGTTVALAIMLGAMLFRWTSPTPRPDRTVVERPPQAPTHVVTPPITSPLPDNPTPVAISTTSRPVPVSIVTNRELTMAPCDQPAASGPAAGTPNVCLLTDDQLLAALAETGEAYGLVRAAGRVEVVRNTP
jgi:hypothetical protein